MRICGLPVEDRECVVDIGVTYARTPWMVARLGLGLGYLLAMMLQVRGKDHDHLWMLGYMYNKK